MKIGSYVLEPIAWLLGTKSAYPTPTQFISEFPSCALQQVQLLSRHGDRYQTSTRDIQRVLKLLNATTDEDFASIYPIPTELTGQLAPAGIRNLEEFGVRLQRNYFEMFQEPEKVVLSVSSLVF
jgi:hypothetical protein